MRNKFPRVSGSYASTVLGGLNPKGPVRRDVRENLRLLHTADWGQQVLRHANGHFGTYTTDIKMPTFTIYLNKLSVLQK